jgi:hypothetical protein
MNGLKMTENISWSRYLAMASNGSRRHGTSTMKIRLTGIHYYKYNSLSSSKRHDICRWPIVLQRKWLPCGIFYSNNIKLNLYMSMYQTFTDTYLMSRFMVVIFKHNQDVILWDHTYQTVMKKCPFEVCLFLNLIFC